jgi:hypothetical protein
METTPVKHGGRYKLQYRGSECPNCGHPLELSDRYCPSCSQANSTKHLTMKDFFDEFFADLVNFDTRLVRTLYTLLWKPGRISKDFIAGKRMSYVNPFRLLLSLAIIYFLMLSFTGDFDRYDRYGRSPSGNIDLIPDGWNVDLDMDDQEEQELLNLMDSISSKELDSADQVKLENLQIKGLEGLKALDSLNLTGKDSLSLKQTLKNTKERRDSLKLANPRAYFDSINGSWLNRTLKKADFFITIIDKDSTYSYDEAVEKHGLPDNVENQFAFGVADSIDHLNRQPGSFLKEFISTVPFAIFLFLPLFTVFLWLVYIRKKYNYTDNLVFSFYSQALFFILLIVSFLIDQIFGTTSIGWFILIFAVYLFLGMRRFYGQGWFKTTVKYIFLNTVFIILASVAAMVFLIGSALTY